MVEASHDLLVIGAGPGGYVAAIRAAQLGMNVGCVEREAVLGGTCLRIGCIPSKALLESSERFEQVETLKAHGIEVEGVSLNLAVMLGRKERVVNALTRGVSGLFDKNGITRYEGSARFVGPAEVAVEGSEPARIRARHIVIATGSKVAELAGVELDGDRIGTSTEALSYEEVPEHLILIGAGVIGLELGSVWRRLGARVTVLEYLPRILPGVDAEVADRAARIFKRQGIDFRLGVRVTAARWDGERCIVECEGQPPIEGDRVLCAVGRVANTDGLGLDVIGVVVDQRGRIPVNPHFETAAAGVYAIGDVIAGPMLAHKAEEEGVACVERIVTGFGHVNYDAIPNVVYTHPEIASVGKSEEELKAAGVDYRIGNFPFVANGRARALGDTDGFVKVLADAATDRVVGVHIIGPRAGDLIAEAAMAIEFGASAEDIARTCHAHPTLSEALKEAALGVDGRMIHL